MDPGPGPIERAKRNLSRLMARRMTRYALDQGPITVNTRGRGRNGDVEVTLNIPQINVDTIGQQDWEDAVLRGSIFEPEHRAAEEWDTTEDTERKRQDGVPLPADVIFMLLDPEDNQVVRILWTVRELLLDHLDRFGPENIGMLGQTFQWDPQHIRDMRPVRDMARADFMPFFEIVITEDPSWQEIPSLDEEGDLVERDRVTDLQIQFVPGLPGREGEAGELDFGITIVVSGDFNVDKNRVFLALNLFLIDFIGDALSARDVTPLLDRGRPPSSPGSGSRRARQRRKRGNGGGVPFAGFGDGGADDPIILEKVCALCKQIPAIVACDKCGSLMYCSSTCKRTHWRKVHRKACRGEE